MRLGLSPKINVPRMLGFLETEGRYFSKATTSDFDNMDELTVVEFISCTTGNIDSYGNITSIYQDTTNDLGFQTYIRGSGTGLSAFSCADGSGAMTMIINTELTGDPSTMFGRFGGTEVGDPTGHKLQSTGFLVCLISRFDASAATDMKQWIVSRNGIHYITGNAGAANLGTMGTSGKIVIGQTDMVGNNPGTMVHKVSIWKSALTNADLAKLVGRVVTSGSNTTVDSNFHMASRFKSYTSLGVTAPDYEWDFASNEDIWSDADVVIESIGGTHTLAATGTPRVGSYFQY